MRRLPKLKQIFIDYLDALFGFNLDSSKFHEERKEVAGACKTAVYLLERVYSAIKEAP